MRMLIGYVGWLGRAYRSYWSQFPEKEQILREKVDWNVSESPFSQPSYVSSLQFGVLTAGSTGLVQR